jgi:hypothetical protein
MTDELTPKASLPIKRAVVIFDMRAFEPVPLAAFELREDGLLVPKGNVEAHATLFIDAARAAVSTLLKKEITP